MKAFLLMIMIPFTLQASSWDDYIAEKRQIVSHERHLPYELNHGHKTAVSVVLIHGIYSSPLYFKNMANFFYDRGYNVITVLLPGHWEKDLRAIDHVSNKQWSREVDRAYEYAKTIGDKVILAGHSLGGLLSIEQATKRPNDEIAGLFVFSPAIKVWPIVLAACRAGAWAHISGNQFLRHAKPDGVTVPYYSPRGGLLIQNLASKVVRTPISVPFFLAYTWNDIEVDIPFVRKYFARLKTPKRVKVYPFNSGISHGDISQGPTDVATFGNKTNQDFEGMMGEASSFLDEQGI